MMELDEVQSTRGALIRKVEEQVEDAADDRGIEVTRAEILDVNLDQATRAAMPQQLNAERARRAQVTEAEGRKRAVELAAEADLFAATKQAEARRVQADAGAHATEVVPRAILGGGLEAAQHQVALKQVEALTIIGRGEGRRTVVASTAALDALGEAFKLLRPRG